MISFVTGGAGLMGSNLVDRLLQLGHDVVAYDDFSSGQERFLELAQASPRFRLFRGDMLDLNQWILAMRDARTGPVFYLAVNANVPFGAQHPRKNLEPNTIATFDALEACV
jgi:UDP-glucose 4-epimerase